MVRLKVFLNGQFSSYKELDTAQMFLAGRGEGCDLVLNAEKGISRQHFQIQYQNGKWHLKVLSRFGELYLDGQKIQETPLKNGLTFTVPPYDFVFESDEVTEEENPSRVSQPSIVVNSADDDRTHVGFMPSAAFLRVVNNHGDQVQTYKLDGVSWVGGRDLSCNIFIDNPRISRRQFEMLKQEEAFYIRDLGSVNITQVNGRPIPADTWTQLTSMDVISVADWLIHFEVRDAHFQERLNQISPAIRSPVIFESNAHTHATGSNPLAPVYGSSPSSSFGIPQPQAAAPGGLKEKLQQLKLNPVRIAIIALVVVAGFYSLFSGSGDSQQTVTKAATPFDKLPIEKQQYVKQAYLAAQAHLAQGNYELARQEIVKIHQELPVYEDSKQIEAAASRGVEMIAEMEKLQQQEAERKKIEEKVNATLRQCKAGILPDTEMPWLEECLTPILEFAPDHPGITELRNEIERNMQERAMKAAQAAEYQRNVALFRSIFKKAEKLEKSGKTLEAIKAYRNASKSKLPDPGRLRSVALTKVKELEKFVLSSQQEFERKADAAYQEERYRDAVELIRKAVSFNPENEVMLGKQRNYEKALTKSMMELYHSGILEESVGNVEVAKRKWKAIIESSLKGEDYFEKARAKLKKYGAL